MHNYWSLTADNVWISERKDKIEDENRILIQKFQSQLTQQLDILHKTVAASVTQQEQQLKDMEEDMQCFVSTKAEVKFIQYCDLCLYSNYQASQILF